MKIIPKIDKETAWQEYHDHNPAEPRERFDLLWFKHPKSIRIIYGWLLAYQDIFDYLIKNYFFDYQEDVYIYPAFTHNACTKDNKIFFNVQRDFNRELDFGLIIHELVHVVDKMSEGATEQATIEIVKRINGEFNLYINHG